MNKLGEFKYIGPCNCGRMGLIDGVMKPLCDGCLYQITPAEINGKIHPVGAVITTWCRSKHHKPDVKKKSPFIPND